MAVVIILNYFWDLLTDSKHSGLDPCFASTVSDQQNEPTVGQGTLVLVVSLRWGLLPIAEVRRRAEVSVHVLPQDHSCITAITAGLNTEDLGSAF